MNTRFNAAANCRVSRTCRSVPLVDVLDDPVPIRPADAPLRFREVDVAPLQRDHLAAPEAGLAAERHDEQRLRVAGSLRSARVIQVLTCLVCTHGAPRYLRSDNGLPQKSRRQSFSDLTRVSASRHNANRQAVPPSRNHTLTIVTQGQAHERPALTRLNRASYSRWKVRALSTRSYAPRRPLAKGFPAWSRRFREAAIAHKGGDHRVYHPGHLCGHGRVPFPTSVRILRIGLLELAEIRPVPRQNRAEGCFGATPVRVASIGGITGQVSGRNVTLLQAVERWRASGRRTPGTPSGTPQIPIVRVAVDTRSRREAFVAMVQPADFGERYHPTRSARLNRPGRGRVLPEREVRVLERW